MVRVFVARARCCCIPSSRFVWFAVGLWASGVGVVSVGVLRPDCATDGATDGTSDGLTIRVPSVWVESVDGVSLFASIVCVGGCGRSASCNCQGWAQVRMFSSEGGASFSSLACWVLYGVRTVCALVRIGDVLAFSVVHCWVLWYSLVLGRSSLCSGSVWRVGCRSQAGQVCHVQPIAYLFAMSTAGGVAAGRPCLGVGSVGNVGPCAALADGGLLWRSGHAICAVGLCLALSSTQLAYLLVVCVPGGDLAGWPCPGCVGLGNGGFCTVVAGCGVSR